MKKEVSKRNPMAGVLRLFAQQKVRPKKGKGSYRRAAKHKGGGNDT